MEEIIKNLYPLNRCLLGEGYDSALKYLEHLIDLEIIEIPSRTKLETWTVPDEWIVKDAWVKFKDKKIIDYQKEPLSLIVGSLPFNGRVTLEELKKHIFYSDDKVDVTPYIFKFYDKDWGFGVPKNQIKEKIESRCEGGVCMPELKEIDKSVGKIQIEGEDYTPKWKDKLEEGEYEVFIDTEFKAGIMKIGVHTIQGKSDKEILLFAHLDHPFQANDNLSGVACLVDLANKIKCDHTVKIIFCPETIGSIGYALTQDISKVDFVIAVDICGNDHTILLQKAFDLKSRLNSVAHCALQIIGKPYRKAPFRSVIGSDEYAFNDPLIGIPGLLITRYPYKEYHTSNDKPEIINYEKIKETQEFILKIIEIWERDYIPKRNWKAPLMRSKYGIQSISPQVNLNYDYLFYEMDGKRSIAELCADHELNFDLMYEVFQKIEKDGQISRVDPSKKRKRKITK